MATRIAIIGNPAGQYYLQGVNKTVGRDLVSIGWRWARGLRGEGPGAWYTTDRTVAERGAASLDMAIEMRNWDGSPV